MPENKDNQRRTPARVERDAFEREIATDLDEETPDKPKGMALHTKILIGLAVGVVAGVLTNRLFGGDHPRVIWIVENITNPVGQLFLRLLLMIVVPLALPGIISGIIITFVPALGAADVLAVDPDNQSAIVTLTLPTETVDDEGAVEAVVGGQLLALIEAGFVYLAKAPLYKIKSGQRDLYIEKESELEEFLLRDKLERIEIFDRAGTQLKFTQARWQKYGRLLKQYEGWASSLRADWGHEIVTFLEESTILDEGDNVVNSEIKNKEGIMEAIRTFLGKGK